MFVDNASVTGGISDFCIYIVFTQTAWIVLYILVVRRLFKERTNIIFSIKNYESLIYELSIVNT